MTYTAAIEKIPRKFLPEDFKITDWQTLQPYFKELLDRPVNSKKNLEKWLQDISELEAVLAQQFGIISGKMTIEVESKEYTLQQAAKFLENPNRQLREEVYRKINERRLQNKEQLNDLYSKLVAKRNQIALNAGFANYRDYKFADLGRFDYTKEDCYQFHTSVKA